MSKRETSHFQAAPAVSTDIAASHSTLLDDLKCVKSKIINRFEKGWERFLNFIWKLTDPDC